MSRSDIKRLHKQGALAQWQDGEDRFIIPSDITHIEIEPGDVLQAGKRKFIRLIQDESRKN